MTDGDFIQVPRNEKKVLYLSAAFALALELAFLLAVGIYHGLLAPIYKKTVSNPTQYIEAELFKMPPIAQLQEEAPSAPQVHPKAIEKTHKLLSKKAAKAPDTVLSKVPAQGKPADKMSNQEANHTEAENQTGSGTALPATHGPIAVYSPSPVIPDYLKDADIKADVVVEFFVTETGESTVHLLSSSGNEELDAIAVGTVSKWRFHAAEENHKTINSKLRLRIVFEVK